MRCRYIPWLCLQIANATSEMQYSSSLIGFGGWKNRVNNFYSNASNIFFMHTYDPLIRYDVNYVSIQVLVRRDLRSFFTIALTYFRCFLLLSFLSTTIAASVLLSLSYLVNECKSNFLLLYFTYKYIFFSLTFESSTMRARQSN